MSELTDHIIEQIIAFYVGEISEAEKRELEAWINESEKQKEDFKRILKMCQRLRMSLAEEQVTRMKARVLNKYNKHRRLKNRGRILRVASYAAIFILATGISFIYYLNRDVEKQMGQKVSLLAAKHGEKVAILRSVSGREWILQENDERELEIDNGIVLKKDSIQNVQDTLKHEERLQENTYNTITIPKGGEYNLTLADGTNVWLNSDSELKFPAQFNGKMREVYLKGEAFFEVKSNPKQPFIVMTKEANVQVFGTSFNVMNYEDEARVEVALQSGKVDFIETRTNRAYPLIPGDMIRMDKESSFVSFSKEDVNIISAWRTGYFYFENMPLEELVVKLERWYQVKFVFANEDVKQMRFTGAVKKYNDLGYVLKVIGKTKDISFVDFGDRIKVYQK
jgi:putative anti-sigma factor